MHPESWTTTLSAAADGDRRAWDELVGRYAGLVWAVAKSFRLSEADAADVSQTVWLQLYRNLTSIREPEALGGWLATTARRESLRLMERRRELLADTDGMLANRADPHAVSPDDAVVRDELVARVRQGLAQLPERCQRLLQLRSLDPRPTNAEIAAALDLPVGSVDYRFRQCAKELVRVAELER